MPTRINNSMYNKELNEHCSRNIFGMENANIFMKGIETNKKEVQP